jgi:hypothetical protein
MAKAMKCSYVVLLEEGKKVDSQSSLINGIRGDKDTFRLVEAFKVIDDVKTRHRSALYRRSARWRPKNRSHT